MEGTNYSNFYATGNTRNNNSNNNNDCTYMSERIIYIMYRMVLLFLGSGTRAGTDNKITKTSYII